MRIKNDVHFGFHHQICPRKKFDLTQPTACQVNCGRQGAGVTPPWRAGCLRVVEPCRLQGHQVLAKHIPPGGGSPIHFPLSNDIQEISKQCP